MPTLGGRKPTSAGDSRASWLGELQAQRAGRFNEPSQGHESAWPVPEQRASHSFAPFLHLLVEERPISAGRFWGSRSRPGQGSRGSGGPPASAAVPGTEPGPTRPPLRAAAPGPPFYFIVFIKANNQTHKSTPRAPCPLHLRRSPGRAVPPTAFLPGSSYTPGGARPGVRGCRVPLLPPPARLPTTSLSRPVHGLKSRDAFEFIECVMSLTRDQTYREGVSFSDGFGDAEAARAPGMRRILSLGHRSGVRRRM